MYSNYQMSALAAQGIPESWIELVKPEDAVWAQDADPAQKVHDRRVEIRVY